MQKEKVNIAQGYPETRDNLNKFKSDYNVEHPRNKLKTLSDAIDKLIEIATVEVPRLEELVSQSNAKIENLEGRIEELEKKQFTEKESGCIRDSLIAIDLCDTEDEEYTNAVEAVLRKLRM